MSVFEDFNKQRPTLAGGGISIQDASFVGPPSSAAGTPFWGDSPELWDQVSLGGVPMPGIARVSGEIEHRVDRKKIPGQDGERITHLGCKPAEIEITLRIWTAEHLTQFERLVPSIRPKPKASAPLPVDIIHPATYVYGIKSIQVLRVGLPQPADVPGVYEVKIRGIEFVAPAKAGAKSKVVTPKGALSVEAHGPGALSAAPAPVPTKPSSANSGPNTTPGGNFVVQPKNGFVAWSQGGGG